MPDREKEKASPAWQSHVGEVARQSRVGGGHSHFALQSGLIFLQK
jgi:hypothetical protein